MDKKQLEERHIFDILAPLLGLLVIPDTVRQGNPPLPDIECEIVGLGPLAVELVALDDKQMRITDHHEHPLRHREHPYAPS